MNDCQHTVLCVDDDKNILNSLKRLLRKEGYRLLTAGSGSEGLQVLEDNDVHLIITDQRMPKMSGTEFLAAVREKHPDTIRIVLTGYTEVDTITESINKGHIYKFFLKPWNDQSLKLEINKALEQYDLVRTNKHLDEKIVEQNEELKRINENLEGIVRERTVELEIQNHVLELSRAVLEVVPVPIVGISAEGLIVVVNQTAQEFSVNGNGIAVGQEMTDYFPTSVNAAVLEALKTGNAVAIEGDSVPKGCRRLDITPLSGRFRDKGVILTFRPTCEMD